MGWLTNDDDWTDYLTGKRNETKDKRNGCLSLIALAVILLLLLACINFFLPITSSDPDRDSLTGTTEGARVVLISK